MTIVKFLYGYRRHLNKVILLKDLPQECIRRAKLIASVLYGEGGRLLHIYDHTVAHTIRMPFVFYVCGFGVSQVVCVFSGGMFGLYRSRV